MNLSNCMRKKWGDKGKNIFFLSPFFVLINKYTIKAQMTNGKKKNQMSKLK